MRASDFEPGMEGAVAEVLESMCFFSVCGELGDIHEDRSGWVSSKLNFFGAPCGSFGVSVPPLTARSIGANFLGEEEADLSDTRVEEVIREVANMACGVLLGRIVPSRTFDLSAPQTVVGVGELSEHSNRIAHTFALDEGSLHAWLEIKDQP